MLNIGDKFPSFALPGVVSADLNDTFIDVNNQTHANKWQVYFFWPLDFTFICPTEIAEFGKLHQDFAERDTVLYGISTDSKYAHHAWKQQKDELRNLPFPMLSDLKKELSQALGILDESAGVAKRAVFIVDPDNIIRFAMITDMKVGRNPREVLRVLDALQTDELCPCNWEKGQKTLATV